MVKISIFISIISFYYVCVPIDITYVRVKIFFRCFTIFFLCKFYTSIILVIIFDLQSAIPICFFFLKWYYFTKPFTTI